MYGAETRPPVKRSYLILLQVERLQREFTSLYSMAKRNKCHWGVGEGWHSVSKRGPYLQSLTPHNAARLLTLGHSVPESRQVASGVWHMTKQINLNHPECFCSALS